MYNITFLFICRKEKRFSYFRLPIFPHYMPPKTKCDISQHFIRRPQSLSSSEKHHILYFQEPTSPHPIYPHMRSISFQENNKCKKESVKNKIKSQHIFQFFIHLHTRTYICVYLYMHILLFCFISLKIIPYIL